MNCMPGSVSLRKSLSCSDRTLFPMMLTRVNPISAAICTIRSAVSMLRRPGSVTMMR